MQIKLKPTLTAPILVLTMYILMAVSNFANISALAQRDNIFLAVIILQLVIFIIPGILYCRFKGTEFTPKLKLKMLKPNKIWVSVFSLFLLISGSSLIKLGLYAVGYYSSQYTLYENYLPADASSLANVLYIIIAIAIMPAITEEFIFRGIVLTEYDNSGVSKTAAVVISALLFAMLHFNLFQLPVYFYGGLVLGYIVYLTDSLWSAVFVHLLNNTYGLLFETQLLRLITQTDSLVFVLFIIAIVFLVFLILTLQAAERIYYSKGINGESSPKRRKKRRKGQKMTLNQEALASPAFIACIVLFLIAAFILK